MLDKSIPYKRIIMKLDYEKNLSYDKNTLPQGYFFKMYEEGLEKEWAKTETKVLEFENEEKALSYFKKDLIPYKEQLKKRMVFVMKEDNIAVANACAWYINYKGMHQAQVHYVAVRPEYQGLGIGKAVFKEALSLFPIYEPGEDIYLHTQTWSYKAIKMYLKMGFQLIKDDSLGYHDKDYQEAVKILESILDESTMKLLYQ
ncbi:MAG: GNAT family N-acetyltransferase [Candidatus Galacturonibacter soehngenii]|nr:GNAT family N-acetyltransferase [Candidatus Galacturonibacter soehngenii]